MSAVSAFADRYAVIPDLRGPRIRLGILWGAGVLVVAALGSWPLAAFLGVTAGISGLQVSARWHEARQPANQPLAGAGALVVVLAAAVNNVVAGLAVILLAGLSVVFPVSFHDAAVTDPRSGARLAWGTLASALPVGLAGAATVQVLRVDAMALLYLLGAVCTYDAGNFLCNGGPRRRLAGPLAGMLGVGVVTGSMYFAHPPPFSRAGSVVVGGVLCVACPLGQLLGSWLLPRARTPAPALRRLDSWLLAAPAMLLAAWIAQS